uniref:Phosphatidylinositol-3-phosphatase SAC1 n=1 Tax=Trichuris muris TaxID=70415 RepID=A0A5S6Q8R4_TRIMR
MYASQKYGTAGKSSEYYLLHVSDERFRIQPCDADGKPSVGACLLIDRITTEIRIGEMEEDQLLFSTTHLIRGLFGIIRLVAGPYLIVISESELVGTIYEQKVFKVTRTELFPFSRSTAHLSEVQFQDNLIFLEMVNMVLSFENFYYSPTFDLTHTLQRLNNTSPEFLLMSLRERADNRFVWNAHLLNDVFLAAENEERNKSFPLTYTEFALPVMLGYMSVREVEIANRKLKLTLISRRSCHRAGVRFQTRGIDEEGNVANFIETEQIVEVDGLLFSYVQTRGSVPLFWTQKPNLCWQPWPKLLDISHVQGIRYHLFSQFYTYGHQVIVSLLNKVGREKRLGDTFESTVKEAGLVDVKFFAIDFHGECKNMNWGRVGQVIDRLLPDIKRLSFFAIRMGDNFELRNQIGVFRTNCMDCLDRTNVVQSLIGLRALELQLQTFGILRSGDQLQDYESFVNVYKKLWADNGDVCSVQYAGTPALKSDFTRTGRRTISGALRDGYNAVMRWYINNFNDGFRQDAIDFFLGGYSGSDLQKFMYSQSRKPIVASIVPLLFIFANCMFILTFFAAGYSVNYIAFWLLVIIMLLMYMYIYGEDIADMPRLK